MHDAQQILASVSRETIERLHLLEALVAKWTERINLISRGSRNDIWNRHILDSAQLANLSTTPTRWLDIGSGGGLPGLVVAILLADTADEFEIMLVESDKRKSAFLKTACRQLELEAKVHASRIESLEPQACSTLSARALAPLATLLEFADIHLAKDGCALLPKGAGWKNELEDAHQKWSFDMDVIESKTNSDAAILRLSAIERK